MAGTPSPIYTARALEVELGGKHVLGPLDLEIEAGSFLGVLGPNGSGKTTLLRALTRGVAQSSGSLSFDGRPLESYRALDLARQVGVVPQQFSLDFNFTVAEMVAMGRYAQRDEAADGEAVAAALRTTGLTALADRLVTELSGGERQRALIAQTLAQRTPTLLLDEPLNNLDLNHQLETMQLMRSLHEEGRTIVVVLHDLNMAAQYCDELLLLDRGTVAARGKPEEVLDPRVILEVFRVRVAVHRQGQRPYITPLWSRSREDLREQEFRQGQGLRIHVIAGGGAASELLEELVMQGFTPTVGIVSVFDSDYAAAQRYELEVVSAPPFQAFPEEALDQHAGLVRRAQMIIVAPIFFGPGNLEPLREALRAARSGKTVFVIKEPAIERRDLSGGEATSLIAELASAGARFVSGAAEAVELVQTHQGGQSDRPQSGGTSGHRRFTDESGRSRPAQ
ncbi:MAG: ABC transporter ATP-binding protein [Actinobacteria bacterium]|nr:ABC transporter ATP-binding protein [Actinomycetota bacterium]